MGNDGLGGQGSTTGSTTSGPDDGSRGQRGDTGGYTCGYNTATDAREAALDEHNPVSKDENREIGGLICTGPHGDYGYTSVNGTLAGVAPSYAPCPDGTERGSSWHTHGNYTTKDGKITNSGNDYYDSEHFSPQDKRYSKRNKEIIGLGTPSGNHYEFDPATGEIRHTGYDNRITSNLPSAKNAKIRSKYKPKTVERNVNIRKVYRYAGSYHGKRWYKSGNNYYSGGKSYTRTQFEDTTQGGHR